MKNQNKYILPIFIFFLLFSNLLSRFFEFEGFNIAFYGIFMVMFYVSLKYRIKEILNVWQFIMLLIFLFYILDPRYDINANILTIKDFIVPILALQIGYYFALNKNEVLDKVNILFLIFVSYALLQEISFYMGIISNILPWDVHYLKKIAETVDGATNYSQGGLLRFFGAMNAFVECQIYIVVICLFLSLNYNELKKKRIYYLNLLGSIIFLVLTLERSPILMGMIILIVWKSPILFKNIHRTIQTLAISTILIFLAASILEDYARYDPMLASAYKRFVNVVTLNFEDDGAIRDRENRLWSEASDLAKDNYFGIGPGKVTPSARYYRGYFGPHNNFLLFYLAYGSLGLVIFLVFLFASINRLFKQPINIRLFGCGLILSYCMMAWFNIPFSSKNGILFFLLLGFLIKVSDIKNDSIKEKYLEIVN